MRRELLDLPTVEKLAQTGDMNHPPRILMLYGSLRERSFSRSLTYEAARILEHKSFKSFLISAFGWHQPTVGTQEAYQRRPNTAAR
jgi:hypothetical protein